MNADGTQPRMLTTGNTDSAPQWSPEGSRIAFVRKPPAVSEFSIWIVDPDDPEPTSVSLDAAASDRQVVWSPDGATLAFVSETGGDTDLYTMSTTGVGRMNRSNDGNVDAVHAPLAFAPDGSAVLYVSDITGDNEIWAVAPTGGPARNLSQSPSTDDDGGPEGGKPQWSPDGSTIYFARSSATPEIAMQMYSMTESGTSQTPRGLFIYSAVGATYDQWPSLSLDGTTMAWVSYRDGDFEIYVAAIDGGPTIRLTNAPGVEEMPTWRPCP